MINFLFLILFSYGQETNSIKWNPDNYCILNDLIYKESVNDVLDCLKHRKKLLVFSEGGSFEEGKRLISFVKNKNITVFCGYCSSMAAYLFLNSNKKEVGEGSKFMLHPIQAQFFNKEIIYTSKTLRLIADELDRDTNSLLKDLPENQRNHFLKNMENQDYRFDIFLLKDLGIKYTKVTK